MRDTIRKSSNRYSRALVQGRREAAAEDHTRAIANAMRYRAAEVAEELNGTPRALTDIATLAEADNMDFCRALDTHVLQCSTCGWWLPTDEAKQDSFGDIVCEDCDT